MTGRSKFHQGATASQGLGLLVPVQAQKTSELEPLGRKNDLFIHLFIFCPSPQDKILLTPKSSSSGSNRLCATSEVNKGLGMVGFDKTYPSFSWGLCDEFLRNCSFGLNVRDSFCGNGQKYMCFLLALSRQLQENKPNARETLSSQAMRTREHSLLAALVWDKDKDPKRFFLSFPSQLLRFPTGGLLFWLNKVSEAGVRPHVAHKPSSLRMLDGQKETNPQCVPLER